MMETPFGVATDFSSGAKRIRDIISPVARGYYSTVIRILQPGDFARFLESPVSRRSKIGARGIDRIPEDLLLSIEKDHLGRRSSDVYAAEILHLILFRPSLKLRTLLGLQLLNEGFDIGLGLLFRITAQVIQITIDGESGDVEPLLKPFRHSVAVVGVVWAGFGIVK